MPFPRTKTAIQALLGAHGLSPRKLRGQNFLVDPNLIDCIVRTADIGPGDNVLEVGTGTGILTNALAERAGRVWTVDVDARLQGVARGLRAWPATVTFVGADVLAGKHRLNPDVVDPWLAAEGRPRLIANLPYAIATPLLANVLWQGLPLHDAVVLVQREAAERFVAATGTAEYGPMAVAMHLLAEAKILRHVGPQVFWPSPRVQSVLLRVCPRDPAGARALASAGLPRLLHDSFLHRRKMLKKSVSADRLAAAGIDARARPQDVSPEQWKALLTVPPL